MVLDGEIVVVDAEGRSRFYDLLYHRGQPVFYAFDCLSLDGRDLRGEPLSTRKRILKTAIKDAPGVIYAQHFAGRGLDLFLAVCERDLEGVVAKRMDAPYGQDWFKIRNPRYSQYEGRRELFEKRKADGQ
jgi:bifunctional non-homologous end joining protein LigD